MKRYLLILISLNVFCASLFADEEKKPVLRRTFVAIQAPAPRLIEPAETLSLAGKKDILFRWSDEGDFLRRDFYDFRLYKGRDSVASNLILNEKTKNASLQAPVSIFAVGQTYTWAVRQVYKTGEKSSRNFESFKVE